MICYQHIKKVRYEVERILLMVDELEKKGIPKDLIVNVILNEHEKPDIEDERTS